MQHIAAKNSSHSQNRDPTTLKQLCLNAINEKSAANDANYATPGISPPLEAVIPTFELNSQQVASASDAVLIENSKITFPPEVTVSCPVSAEITSAIELIPRPKITSGTQGKQILDCDTDFRITKNKNMIFDCCNIAFDGGLNSAPKITPVKITYVVSIENPEDKAHYISTFENLLLKNTTTMPQ